MLRFFVYDPAYAPEFRTFENFAETVKAAMSSLAEYFDPDDGWLEGVERVCMGIVSGQSEAVMPDDSAEQPQVPTYQLIDYMRETIEQLGGLSNEEVAAVFAPPPPRSEAEKALEPLELLRQSRTALTMANDRLADDRRAVGLKNQIRGVLKKIDELMPPPKVGG